MNNQWQSCAFVVNLSQAVRKEQVGGKAVNLARLIHGGFNVPDGFVVTTTAFCHARETNHGHLDDSLADAISTAYRALGEPVVAVRSSATAEDLADSSMAGQYETFLNRKGIVSVLAAVEACWQSLCSERSRSYLEHQGIDADSVAMAVVVQRQVPARVAGVMFTCNPQTGDDGELVIEATWGLGEAVVSGSTQPDTLWVRKDSGMISRIHVAEKESVPLNGGEAPGSDPTGRHRSSCLDTKSVEELRATGRRIESYYGAPQDVEWAIDEHGELFILQSRPITSLEQVAARKRCQEEVLTWIRQRREEGYGPWVRHNLGETLPLPSPLTWSIISKFMSGAGGWGSMYRQVGFEPAANVREDGGLALIGGRIYLDLSVAHEMFAPGFPYRFDPGLLRQNPQAAQSSPTRRCGTFREQRRAAKLLYRVERNLHQLATSLHDRLETEIIPQL
ncbi:MAG: hypothetical protein D6820_03460, partial [Lentisphaerae bacterium]